MRFVRRAAPRAHTVRTMPIAITDDHLALTDTVADLLQRRDARGATRALLEADTETLPPFWAEAAEIGWLGLHLPEAHGGSGYGLPELVVVVEEFGANVAPGPFVPTVIASATIAAAAPAEVRARLLPGLADGSRTAGIALETSITHNGSTADGSAIVLAGGLADLLMLASGDDVVLVDRKAAGVSVTVPTNLDPARRSARVTLTGAAVEVLPGARSSLVDYARTLLAAEATGVARECTRQAAEYAKARTQFGRPIAMYQAVKHHCANMAVASELALRRYGMPAAPWPPAPASSRSPLQWPPPRRSRPPTSPPT